MVADLQRHLNNPLLQPEWVHVKLDGQRVELEKSCFYKTVQRRYAEIADQDDRQPGSVMQEITMRPGDALYARAGVPHRCTTTAPISLHMAFDLIDNTSNTADIARQATNQYNYACELPYSTTSSPHFSPPFYCDDAVPHPACIWRGQEPE
ncbi:MAG: cupin domain-containing protein [Gammaproteobacteria bacterium]|nr:cupin domain-containing protein [Gammaproteobacteria bacterium]